MTMISESELSLLLMYAIDANIVWRWLVIRSNSRMAWVNHITTVKLTSVITNAPMVVRNMYRPIDPMDSTSPQTGAMAAPAPHAVKRNTAPRAEFPRNSPDVMLSQNGLAKAMSLNLQS